jgi:rod shape-determining protein MreC
MNMRTSVSRRRSWLVGGGILVAATFFLVFHVWMLQLMSPLLRLFSLSAHAITDTLTSEEQEDLEQQLASLALDQVEFERLRLENETLREELGFMKRSASVSVAAAVLSKSLSQTVSRLLLDVGAQEGVEVGDPVVAENGLLVGVVTQVDAHLSHAVGVTDPSHTTAVSLLNDRRTIGVAYGSVGGLIEVRYIPSGEGIAVNDLVVTSGLDETIPSGLLIGVVNAVSEDPSTLFLTAVVEPLADLRRLSHVLILTEVSL